MPTSPRSDSQFTVFNGVNETATLSPACVTRRTCPHLPSTIMVSVPSGRNAMFVSWSVSPVGTVTTLKPAGSANAAAGSAVATNATGATHAVASGAMTPRRIQPCVRPAIAGPPPTMRRNVAGHEEARRMAFDTKVLPVEVDATAPDGSDVRLLLSLAGGSAAHFELDSGQTSVAVRHRSVEEIW